MRIPSGRLKVINALYDLGFEEADYDLLKKTSFKFKSSPVLQSGDSSLRSHIGFLFNTGKMLAYHQFLLDNDYNFTSQGDVTTAIANYDWAKEINQDIGELFETLPEEQVKSINKMIPKGKIKFFYSLTKTNNYGSNCPIITDKDTFIIDSLKDTDLADLEKISKIQERFSSYNSFLDRNRGYGENNNKFQLLGTCHFSNAQVALSYTKNFYFGKDSTLPINSFGNWLLSSRRGYNSNASGLKINEIDLFLKESYTTNFDKITTKEPTPEQLELLKENNKFRYIHSVYEHHNTRYCVVGSSSTFPYYNTPRIHNAAEFCAGDYFSWFKVEATSSWYDYADAGHLVYYKLGPDGTVANRGNDDPLLTLGEAVLTDPAPVMLNKVIIENYLKTKASEDRVVVLDNGTLNTILRLHMKKEERTQKVVQSKNIMTKKITKVINNLETIKKTKLNGIDITEDSISYAGQTLSIDKNTYTGHDRWLNDVFDKMLRNTDPNSIDWDLVYATFLSYLSLGSKSTAGTIGNVNFNLEIKSSPSTRGVTSTRYYINENRINKNEVDECLERALCFETQEDFDYFLDSVRKCSLKLHKLLHRGINISGVSDVMGSSPGHNNYNQFSIKFPITRKGRTTSMVLDGNSYRIRNTNRFLTISNKRSILDVVDLLLNEKIVEGVTVDDVKDIITAGRKAYVEALKKSQELLTDTIKLFKLTEETKDTTRGRVKGYKIKGKIRTYFVEKGSLEPDSNNHNDCKVFDYNSGKYICIVDKGNAAQVGMDRLVNRLYALHNDDLVAKEITTL